MHAVRRGMGPSAGPEGRQIATPRRATARAHHPRPGPLQRPSDQRTYTHHIAFTGGAGLRLPGVYSQPSQHQHDRAFRLTFDNAKRICSQSFHNFAGVQSINSLLKSLSFPHLAMDCRDHET